MTTPATRPISVQEVFDHAGDAIFVVDRDRRFVLVNPAIETLTGYKPSDLMNHQCTCSEVSDCRDEWGRSLAGCLCPGLALFKGDTAQARQRMQIKRKDGATTWIETTYAPVREANGEVRLVLGIARDAGDAVEKEALLRSATENLHQEVQRLRRDIHQRHGFDTIISRSSVMEPAFEKTRAACANASPVFLSGEPGTGKELIARTIHAHGLQKDGPFVAFNCAAVSKEALEGELFGHSHGNGNGTGGSDGAFRAAEGGTLFLDEITELPKSTQARLLRTLQDHRLRPVGTMQEFPIRVRIIASSRHGLERAVADGLLRQDLAYALGIVTIDVPPLRARSEDIPFLVQHFLEQSGDRSRRAVDSVEPEAWRLLTEYAWPGNVRELQNAIEAAIANGQGPCVQAAHLPPKLRGESPRAFDDLGGDLMPLDSVLERVERQAILESLRRTEGHRSRAAKVMGISRSRLYRRMEALGISPRDA